MKKSKIITLILTILFIAAAVLPLTVSAASEASNTLAGALGGKKALMFPEYIDGGSGFNEKENSESLFYYDENEDNGNFPKYCTNQLPYWAEWKYDKAYAVERIILRTANDNESYPRRMGDGWTLSGSNDGKAWTVIYTGKEDDVININFKYYYVDLPDNKTKYQYYKLNSDKTASDQSDFIVQLSMIILCVDPSVATPAAAAWKPKDFKIGSTKTIITAVDFDAGADKYSVAQSGNHDIRPDEAVNTEPGGSEFGGNIGWITAGDWVRYSVKVQRDGAYKFSAWLASDADPTGGVKIYINDKEIGTSPNSSKDGWQTYALYPVGETELTAGDYIIKVEFTGGCNFSALEVVRTGNIGGNAAPAEEDKTPDAAAAAADDNAADSPAKPAANNTTNDDEGNLIIFVISGAGVLVVIVIIIVIMIKEKK